MGNPNWTARRHNQGGIIDNLFHLAPPTEELEGEITQVGVDPQADGKSTTFRVDSMPDALFRQQLNALSPTHRQERAGEDRLQPDRRRRGGGLHSERLTDRREPESGRPERQPNDSVKWQLACPSLAELELAEPEFVVSASRRSGLQQVAPSRASPAGSRLAC